MGPEEHPQGQRRAAPSSSSTPRTELVVTRIRSRQRMLLTHPPCRGHLRLAKRCHSTRAIRISRCESCTLILQPNTVLWWASSRKTRFTSGAATIFLVRTGIALLTWTPRLPSMRTRTVKSPVSFDPEFTRAQAMRRPNAFQTPSGVLYCTFLCHREFELGRTLRLRGQPPWVRCRCLLPCHSRSACPCKLHFCFGGENAGTNGSSTPTPTPRPSAIPASFCSRMPTTERQNASNRNSIKLGWSSGILSVLVLPLYCAQLAPPLRQNPLRR